MANPNENAVNSGNELLGVFDRLLGELDELSAAADSTEHLNNVKHSRRLLERARADAAQAITELSTWST